MDTFLLCSPDFFKLDNPINPWMVDSNIDLRAAKSQWFNLVSEIQKAGGKVKVVNQIEELPDMVFAANSGVVSNNIFISSNMKYDQRKPEVKHYKKWFSNNGYSVVDIVPSFNFEGCGDVIIHKNMLIGGYGYRSDLPAIDIVASTLNLELASLKLADPRYYHLDTCFCIVSDSHAIYYPKAFCSGEIKKLKNKIELIPVCEEDARLFMCNSMLVNDTLLVPEIDTKIGKKLRDNFGIKIKHVKVQEFLKSGGSIQCLCLKI
jgi:N-dimethylarginine dimethylaminohydrolase